LFLFFETGFCYVSSVGLELATFCPNLPRARITGTQAPRPVKDLFKGDKHYSVPNILNIVPVDWHYIGMHI
jgi:hypothetical protein